MPSTRSSTRSGGANSSPSSSQGNKPSDAAAAGTKRKASGPAPAQNKRGKKEEQKTLEQTLGNGHDKPKENGQKAENKDEDMKDAPKAELTEEKVEEATEHTSPEQTGNQKNGESAPKEDSSESADTGNVESREAVVSEPKISNEDKTEDSAVQSSQGRAESTPSSVLEKVTPPHPFTHPLLVIDPLL